MKTNKCLIFVWVIMISLMFPGLVLSAQAQPRAKSVISKKQMKAVSGKIKKLPDLIVSNIELIKGCKIQVTIKNIGTAGVPDSGYDLRNGVGIQMFKGGKAWGGIRLGAVDRSKRLKKPGSFVQVVWFSKAKNLALGCGTHSIKVIVDNNHAVNELNENNNSKTVRLQCKEGCDKKSRTTTPRTTSGISTKAAQKSVPRQMKKLPDLIVSNIELIKGCKIQVTIKNIGTAGVPDSGYDLRNGVGIQMFKGGKAWGGIRLGAVDRSKRLKKPGSLVQVVWFSKAKNLALGCGTHSIKVIVDNNHAVNELNENNNSKTVRLQCKEGCDKKSRTTTPRTTSGISTKAAQKSVPRQMKGAMVSSGQVHQFTVPDLVLIDFSVNQNAVQQVNNVFKFPFSVRIKNIGTGDVKNAYDLSFQTYNNGWGGHNQPGFNCKRINRQLKKDQSHLYTGTLSVLNYDISGQNLRIRAYVDAACSEEFPKSWGHVGESDENNNHSNEVTLSGGYHPNIGSITPNFCVLGSDEVIMLGGMGFGNTQGSHTVVLRNGNTKTAANITDWHNGVIYFKVPSGTAIGLNKVTIADATSLHRVSTANEVSFDVLNTKILTWTRLIDVWDLFNEAFKIEINTHGGGSKYQNTSKLTLLRSTDINVPLIQFNLAGLKYRFLVKDMNSKVGGIILTKQGCSSNQLKMEVSFESAGKELKGFNRALVPGAAWCDGCVADVHINNGKMIIIFDFSATNGHLNFGVTTNFNASVSASNTFADGLMDLFLGNWNNDVRNQINNGVRAGLLSSENRAYILSELENLIQMLLGLDGKQITDMAFKYDGIHVTYANP